MIIAEIEQIVVEETSNGHDEEIEHWICPVCYPDYDPERKVVALCGKTVEDVPISDTPTADNYTHCVVCINVKCKECGYRYYI